MNLTIPFLIFIIITALVLLYKIAGVNLLAWDNSSKSKPKKETKVEPKKEVRPELVTQKSFLHKKKEVKAEPKKEPINKPSAGAQIVPVFQSSSAENNVLQEMKKIETESFNQHGLDLLATPPVQKIEINDEIPQKPSFVSNRRTTPSSPPSMFSQSTKGASSPLFGGNRDLPFGTRERDFPFGNRNNKKSFNLMDDIDSMFDDEDEVVIDSPDHFEKMVIGEKVASTESKKKKFYWM